MSGPTASSRVRNERLRRLAPAVAVLLVALLAGLSVGSSWLVARHLRRAGAHRVAACYSVAFRGLERPRSGCREQRRCSTLGAQVRELGLPLVVTDASGRGDRHRQPAVRRAARRPAGARVHRGARRGEPAVRCDRRSAPCITARSRQSRILTALALLQAVTILDHGHRGDRRLPQCDDRPARPLWVAMAREAAHQMGTPLTSLAGLDRTVARRRPAAHQIAEHLDADAERLERVAQRFERIGNPARRDPVGARCAGRAGGRLLSGPRLPKHANPIELSVRGAERGARSSSATRCCSNGRSRRWSRTPSTRSQGRGGTITLRGGGVAVTGDAARDRRRARRPARDSPDALRAGHHHEARRLGHRPRPGAPGGRGRPQGTIDARATVRGTTFLMRIPARRPRRHDRGIDLLRGLNPAQREAVGARPRSDPRDRRRRVREDPRADDAHRAPDRRARRPAAAHLRRHLHQQGRRRDEGADRRSSWRATRRPLDRHLPLPLGPAAAARGGAPRLLPPVHHLRRGRPAAP